MIQERKYTEKDVPQVIIQQLPKHQLWRNNSQHKARPSLNNSQHKVRPSPIPDKNMPHHNSAVLMMTNFQIHFRHPQRLLRQKIQNLYRRNQNIVQAKSNLCNSFLPELIYYTCYYFLFTDRCRKMRYKQGNSFPYVIFSWCQMRQKFFSIIYYLPTLLIVLNITLFYVNYSSNKQVQ